MSAEIQWGAEIAVNGVRPEWLRDEAVRVWNADRYRRGIGIGIEGYDWDEVSSIVLRADHSYYLATSRGFTYWPGGESAPEDWDGGEVLYADENSYGRKAFNWRRQGFDWDIIGYRKRTEQPAPAIDPALVERMVALVRHIATGAFEGILIEAQARDILKALDPVDPDYSIAEDIADEYRGGLLGLEAFMLKAIKRGRELERERGEAE